MQATSLCQDLSSRLGCEVVCPDDGDRYDAARRLFNARIDKRPAAIVYCRTTADVVATLEVARSRASRVSIRSGGCSFAGFSSNDGGVLLDVSRINGLRVEPRAGTAVVGPGLTMGELYTELQARNLVLPGGECPIVAVAGLTQGGGMSILSRSLGMTCDNLLAAEVVDASGAVRIAAEGQDSDLLWALRGGGGGNFGVVTSLTFRLHPLPETLWGGLIAWPLEQAREVFLEVQEYCSVLADELGVMFAFLSAPGEKLFIALPIYHGPVAAGKAAVRPLAAVGRPLKTDLQEWVFNDFLEQHFPAPDGRLFEYLKSAFFDGPVPPAALDVMMSAFDSSPSQQTTMSFELCGGAVNRVPAAATAFVHRDDFLLFGAFADSTDEAGYGSRVGWAEELYAALAPYLSNHHYRNYPDLSLADWQRGYYGSNYERLAELKKRYDPEGLFRFAQGVGS